MAEVRWTGPLAQHDLQHTRKDDTHLRTVLQQLQMSDASAPYSFLGNEYAKLRAPDEEEVEKGEEEEEEDGDVDGGFDRALARRQARLDLATDSMAKLAAGIELKSTNDRVALLERQLLDAEEIICHLKAEKLAALRSMERLSVAAADGGKKEAYVDGDRIQKRDVVLELETRLAEQNEKYARDQKQSMAVIRDQKSELEMLRKQVAHVLKQYEELQQRHMELLELDEPVTMMQQGVTSDDVRIFEEERNQDNKAKAIGLHKGDSLGRARALADADAVNSKWQEELVRHPTPHFEMQSPEVSYILQAWTQNIKKIRYLRRWLIQVVVTKGPLPDDFPMAVELPRLPLEVRDGFLTLVLPLLRKQTEREIIAHSRRYNDGIHIDLRFRVVPR
ncbi:unnamed protein product [Hyaloperonospora brassicae]|uniref:Uncharacterized protein n=1 Tax=Hyaloperonospora brassicae TaxID=162125 RepID=A0AAV0T5P6_HYABA|nr:unnamed protein product [Hyaloperonospora brassicae]